MSFEDERIVKMTFDNKAFTKNIESTIHALQRLEKTMNLDDVSSSRAFDNFVDGVEESDAAMNTFDGTVNKVKASFSLLQVAGYTAMAELTRYAINAGKKIYNNTLGQIKSGGLTRALNIEAAKFQIEGLGHTWDEVSSDIDYAVKGTAYGMDSAAKAASQLLASQIQAGDQMKVSLRGISGLAAVTNSSYDDIADIFTTVAGNGRLMGDQLNRISYRGINAAQVLMDYFNNVKGITVKTEAELRDMVSKGKISFMEFAAAMDSAFGEHAKDANKTFTGAISNMKAALSRIGEKFFTPFNEFERRLAVAIIPTIDNVKNALSNVLPVFNTIIDSVAVWVERLTSTYHFQKAILNVVIGIWGWIQNILGALYELGFALPEIDTLAVFIERVTSALVLNEEEGRHVREIVKTIVKSLSILITIIQGILYILEPIYKPILSFLKDVNVYNKGVLDKSSDIIDKINYIIKVIAILIHIGLEKAIQVVIAAIKILIGVVKAAGAIIAWVVLGISKLVKALKIVVDAIRDYGEKIWDVIKSLGDGFVKFYDLIREIFTNIGTGMDKFLENAQDKTSALWKTINSMVGTKKLNVVVDITTKATKLNPADVVSKNATSGLKNAAKASEAYSDSMNDASAANSSFKKSGVGTGGGYGSMGNLVDTSGLVQAAFRGVGDGSREMADQVDQNANRATRSMSRLADATSASTTAMTSPDSGGKFAEKAASIFDAFIEKLEYAKAKLDKARGRIVEHFSNFFAVLIDVITLSTAAFSIALTVLAAKLIKTIFGVVDILPQIASALNGAAKGFKYAGMAEAFKGFALALLALGALLATIAIISKLVDYADFKKFIGLVALLIAASSILAFAVSKIVTAVAVLNLINNLSGIKPLTTRITNFISSMKDLFIGLAILIGTIVAGVVVIQELAKKNGGYDEINKAAMLIGGLILATGAFMLIVTKVIGGSGGITERMHVGLDGVTRSVSSSLGGVIRLINVMIPLIAVIVGSIYLLARQEVDLGRASAAFGIIMGSFLIVFTSIVGVTAYLNERVTNSKSAIDKGAGLTAIMHAIGGLIMAVSGFMLSFVAAVALLSLIPQEKQDFAFKMMRAQMIFMSAILGGIGIMVVMLNKSVQNASAGLAKVTTISKTLGNMAALISAIGGAMMAISLSIAGSLAIISIIPADKMMSSLKVFLIAVGVVSLVLAALIWSMKSFSAFTSAGPILGGKTRGILENVGAEVAAMIGAMSVMMLSISASLTMLSLVDSSKLMKAAHSIGIITVIMGVLLSAIVILTKSTGSYQQLLSGTKSQKITGFLTNTGTTVMQILSGMSLMMMAIASALYVVSTINPDSLLYAVGAFSVVFAEVAFSILGILAMIAFVEKSFKGTSMTKNRLQFMNDIKGILLIITASIASLMASVLALAVTFDEVDPNSIIASLSTMGISFVLIMASLMSILYAISKMNVAKIKMNPKDLMAIGGLLIILSASISAMMIAFAGMATILDGVENIARSFGALAGLFIGLGVIVGLIVYFGPQITAAATAIGACVTFVMAFSIFMIAFAGAAYILGKVDWSNISNNLSAFGTLLLSVMALTVVITLCSIALSKAIAPLIVLSMGISTVVMAIAYSIVNVIKAYNNIILALNDFANIEWDKLKSNTANMTAVLTSIKEAVSGGVSAGISAIALGIGLKAFAAGLAMLAEIDTFKLSSAAGALKTAGEGIKDACTAIMVIMGGLLAVAMVMGFVGPILLAGIVTLVLAFMVLFGSIPIIMALTVKAIESIAGACDRIKTGIDTIKEKFNKDFAASVTEACESLTPLIDLGILMFFAGVLLAIGTGAFLVGAVLLLPALALLKLSIEQAPNIIGDISVFTDMMNQLGYAAFYLLITSALMGIAVSVALPTFAILLGCTALICLTLAQAPYILSMVDPMVTAIGGLELVAAAMIMMGIMMSIGASFLGIAAMAMMPVILLLAGALGTMYIAVTLFDWKTILIATGLLLMVVASLGLIGFAIIIASVPLIVGAGLLAVAAVLFTIVGVSMAVACAAFLVGVLAVWGIVEVIKMIDFAGALEKMEEFTSFIFKLSIVAALMVVVGVILLIAGVLLSAAAIFLSVAIITLSLSLLIGAALLLASGYILQQALEQLEVTFQYMDIDMLLSGAFQLLIFGAVLGIAGLILLIGSVLLLPGAIILSVSATQLAVALPMLKKAFDKGLSGKDFLKNATLYLTSAALMLGAGGMLMIVGPMFSMFAKSFSTAGTMVVNTINSLKDAAGSVGDLVDSFADAGTNIVEGITTGIVDSASDVVDSIADVAESTLDTFCDVLGIHSPAEEFIKRAANCIAGIAEGLGMDHDEVYNAITGVGMGMLNTFEGMGDGFQSVGSSLGDIFMGGMGDKIKELMPDLANGVLGDLSSVLTGAQTAAIQKEMDMAAQLRNEYLTKLQNKQLRTTEENDFLQASYDYWDAEYKRLAEQKDAYKTQDWGNVINDQLGNWGVGGSGGTDIDYSMLDSATSEALGGSNLGKMATDASKVGGNVGTAITNNTYNFTQNNYSPEPIDRTELYVQTNNQLDTWYKWLRDNN